MFPPPGKSSAYRYSPPLSVLSLSFGFKGLNYQICNSEISKDRFQHWLHVNRSVYEAESTAGVM
jgi:hypothetical protein